MSLRSILILPYHLCLSLPNGLFPSCLPTKIFCAFLTSPTRVTFPVQLILLDLITLMLFGEQILFVDGLLGCLTVSYHLQRLCGVG